ncbi:hypothetical protein M758_4G049700 [Ceratodon purpureus]|nr:hypothetical protein M758_4G049700 [Ceratodon purpureus]
MSWFRAGRDHCKYCCGSVVTLTDQRLFTWLRVRAQSLGVAAVFSKATTNFPWSVRLHHHGSRHTPKIPDELPYLFAELNWWEHTVAKYSGSEKRAKKWNSSRPPFSCADPGYMSQCHIDILDLNLDLKIRRPSTQWRRRFSS